MYTQGGRVSPPLLIEENDSVEMQEIKNAMNTTHETQISSFRPVISFNHLEEPPIKLPRPKIFYTHMNTTAQSKNTYMRAGPSFNTQMDMFSTVTHTDVYPTEMQHAQLGQQKMSSPFATTSLKAPLAVTIRQPNRSHCMSKKLLFGERQAAEAFRD